MSIEECMKLFPTIFIIGIAISGLAIITQILAKGSIGLLGVCIDIALGMAFIVIVFGYQFYKKTDYLKEQKVSNFADFVKSQKQKHHVVDQALIQETKEALAVPTS